MKKKWKVRNDLMAGKVYGEAVFAPERAKYLGREVTPAPVIFNIEEDNREWGWSPEMFEDESSDCPFRRGEEVEVWGSNENHPNKRIFVAYIQGAAQPYLCVIDGDEQDFIAGKKFRTVPWEHCRSCHSNLKENDPVIVWDDNGFECRRFFAGWTRNGKIMCFKGGLTKWTSRGQTMTWKHWRLPTEEELED